VQTAEHILLHCSRFAEKKVQLEALAGAPLNPRGLNAAMMADNVVWDRVHVIIVTMMKRFRKEEMVNQSDG